MCEKNWEFIDHLLHCDVAYAIWIAFFSNFGLSWVMSRSIVDLYAC
jgi:hypothetical protein